MKKTERKSITIFIAAFLILIGFIFMREGSFRIFPVSAQESSDVSNDADSENLEEDEVVEDEIEETEEDIEKYEERKEKTEEQKNELEQDLSQIQNFIYYTQKEINKTEESIDETEETISRKESELDFLNRKSELQKNLLGKLIREMHYSKKEPFIGIFLGENKFTQMLGNIDYFLTTEEKLIFLVDDIKRLKRGILEEKKELEEIKEDHQQLLEVRSDQQEVLIGDKIQTQSEISEKAATIQQLQAKISKLKSNLSKLLGKSYNAKDIEDAAKFASRATGVRKDFIMGMLVVESDLGRYTGGCDYKASRMSSYRKEIFKDICEELDYNYKKMKVSCPPSGYSGTGGAMGVAQFMPDTWMGYESSIASLTGHDPPDPWNLTDGVTAMALKLAKVPGVTSHKKSAEKDAAKLYLSGTTSSKYNWYGEKVLYWADNYEKLLD